jgi:hypothetical protein
VKLDDNARTAACVPRQPLMITEYVARGVIVSEDVAPNGSLSVS